MPLVPATSLLAAAARGNYAVGYFESWNLESLAGTIDALEESRSPGVIGFNGEFLTRSGRRARERLAWYAALGRAAADGASVPCALIFNECSDDARVREACDLGFNLVMPSDPGAEDAHYRRRVRELVAYAHEHGADVEAEVGLLPDGHGGGGAATDPRAAEEFVRETGADFLAVSVGNIHVLTRGSEPLDIGRIEEIVRVVPVPLVLHGGTGILEHSLQEAIGMGVRKVNFGTYLKQRALEVMRRQLSMEIENPHELLGLGGDRDVMVAVCGAVKQAVMERLPMLGCEGKADVS